MRVLITGAFGNVGTSILREFQLKYHAGQHTIRCFDLNTPKNRRTARRYAGKIEVVWGDVLNVSDVKAAVKDCDVVIHLIAIIPPRSIAAPELARRVNVDGTKNVIAAMHQLPKPARLIFASSLALFGQTQHLPPPRTVYDPIQITDVYTETKALCEALVKESGLTWTILRFAAVLPVAVLNAIDPLMFEVPLTDRAEFVHTYDVGLALTNAVFSDAVWGKTLLIGGGKRCQLYQRELIAKPLEALGIGMLPDSAFGTTPYHLDWLDTTESQQLLQFQRYDLDDYVRDTLKAVGFRRFFIPLVKPLIRHRLLSASPYYRKSR
jgi:nucleoside-diphosphate-sugar epimerase